MDHRLGAGERAGRGGAGPLSAVGRRRTAAGASAALLLSLACANPGGEVGHGHDHGAGGHDHGGADHGHAEEGPSLARTRWSADHELFIELEAPVAGAPFGYHAHVTRLSDNAAASSGVFLLRFEQDGFPAESHRAEGVSRAGIFSGQAPAPMAAGEYQLLATYSDGERRVEWSLGPVQVGAGQPLEPEAEAEGEIAFLKEAQWQIPFRVVEVEKLRLDHVGQAWGRVVVDPASTALLAAPGDGLLVWGEAQPVVGRQVQRGEPLGWWLPATGVEPWAVLQADLTSARLEKELAEVDLRRAESLLTQGFGSERRVEEARLALGRAAARQVALSRQLAALTRRDGGAIPLRAPADGLLVAVGAAPGAGVRSGEPLLTVATGEGLLIQAQVLGQRDLPLSPLHQLHARRASGEGIDLLAVGAHLLTERLVVDPATLRATLDIRVPGGSGLRPGETVAVTWGVPGEQERLAVPRSAVVEVVGQDVVFVQKTGESFSRRRVRLGPGDSENVSIEQGLQEGERVVAVGGFDVHVASLSGALESHRH